MNQQHIENLLDRQNIKNLTGEERNKIEAHCAICPPCLSAVRAAEFTQRIVEAEWNSEISAPPFFSAEVLRQWRETRHPAVFETFKYWWRSTAALVLLMTLTALGLAAAALFADSRDAETVYSPKSERQKLYSTDKLILNQKNAAEDLTTDDVYEILDNR